MTAFAKDIDSAVNRMAGFQALQRMRAHQEAKANAKIRWTRWIPPQDPDGLGALGVKCSYYVAGHLNASVEVDKQGRHHLSVGHDERTPTIDEIRSARVELCPQAEWLFASFHRSVGPQPSGPSVVSLLELRDDDGVPAILWTPKS